MYWSRWSPANANWWNEVTQFQNEVNRFLDRWNNGSKNAGFPACNVWEEGDALVLEAELPGLDLNDLEIYVNQNELTIKGERKLPVPEKAVRHRQERSTGAFGRTLALPVLVDANKVEAHLDNGVLTIRLAKQEQAKPRKIAVKG
jgi:HSP20 family protein